MKKAAGWRACGGGQFKNYNREAVSRMVWDKDMNFHEYNE